MPAEEVPLVVRTLQKARVLQAQGHHLRHHAGIRDTHYCVVTNLLNPLLDHVYFWRVLEAVIEGVLGQKRRPDVSFDPV
jgi:ubiquitin-conjugating enzyme E2 variant